MEIFTPIIYTLVCISIVYWGVRAARNGRRYNRGESQYKSWIPPKHKFNQDFGLNLKIVGLMMIIAGISGIVFFLSEILFGRAVGFEIACFTLPVLLVCVANLYNLNEKMNYKKPE